MNSTPSTAPLELTISGFDNLGRGLARDAAGHLIRVPGVDDGERVRVVPVAGRRGRLFGRLEEVLEPSPARVDPGCPQAWRCPGCALRHLGAARQLEVKRAALQRTLQRMGGIDPGLVEQPVPHPDPAGHRIRAVAACLPGSPLLVLGMRALPGCSPGWVDLSCCPAQRGEVNGILARAAAGLQALGLAPACRDTGEGLLRHLLVHGSEDGGGRAVLAASRTGLPAGGPEPLAALLAERLLPGEPPVSIGLDLLAPRSQASSSSKLQMLRGDERVRFRVGGFEYTARTGSWTPISPGAAHLLSAAVAELLDGFGAGDGSGRLLEIGCGVGTLTLPLAARFAEGIGVDASRSAIEDAEENRGRAGIANLRFRVGWAHHAVRRLAAAGEQADTVLLHSIRLPYGPAVLDLLPALGARRLVYVSPSAVSLGLDLGRLAATGWRVERIIPVDQLPATAHIMGVAALSRG